jgi:hypothetical protein
MRLRIALVATAAAMTAAGAAQAAAVEITDAVARVTVIPENRTTTKVEIVRNNPRLPIQVRTVEGRTIIDGQLDGRIRNCRVSGERGTVEVRGVGDVAYADMPQIVVRTPREAVVRADGAVFGAVGRSATLEFSNAGCGDWTVANVEGRLRLHVAGSGDTRTGSAGTARIRVAGSGDVSTAEVRGGLDVNVAGSGDVSVASIAGPLDVSVAGSGDVRVDGGRASSMAVSIAGSGDVNFHGVAETLNARIAGSGDVRVRQVRGSVSRSVVGSGGVRIGH